MSGPAPRVLALYRQPSYSPNQHRANDTAILDAAVARLAARGWEVARASEGEVLASALPDADLVLNMCQGPDASEKLLPLENSSVPIINRPSSVLSCHRHRLVTILAGRPVAFPRTAVISTTGRAALDGFGVDGRLILTSDEVLSLERAPASVAIIGGG